MSDQMTIPPAPPPPPPPSNDPAGRAVGWVAATTPIGASSRDEGGTPGSDREGVDRGFTLAAQAASSAQQAASGPPGSLSVSTVPAGDVRAPNQSDGRREARAAARAAKADERRLRRADRTAFLRQPVPVDRSWAKWVGGGFVLLAVCGFMWKVAERHAPTLVVNTSQPTAATTATSGAGLTTNPFQGVGHPVANLAAAIISSYDPAGRTVVVATSSGDLSLGAGRVEDLAGQMWAMGQTDPCDVYITSPDPRQSPKAVKKVDGQPLPAKATALFDCTTPTTTAAGAKAGE